MSGVDDVLYYNKNTFRKAGVKEPDTSSTYNEYAGSARRLPPKERQTGFNFWTALGTGQIAMAEDGMRALKNVARVEGLEFDIAPIPKGPKQRLSWITTDGWGMWNGSKARSAAWELMKFIASPEWFKLQSRIELYRDGTAKPTVFRDCKDQIDQAASICGLTLK